MDLLVVVAYPALSGCDLLSSRVAFSNNAQT